MQPELNGRSSLVQHSSKTSCMFQTRVYFTLSSLGVACTAGARLRVASTGFPILVTLGFLGRFPAAALGVPAALLATAGLLSFLAPSPARPPADGCMPWRQAGLPACPPPAVVASLLGCMPGPLCQAGASGFKEGMPCLARLLRCSSLLLSAGRLCALPPALTLVLCTGCSPFSCDMGRLAVDAACLGMPTLLSSRLGRF